LTISRLEQPSKKTFGRISKNMNKTACDNRMNKATSYSAAVEGPIVAAKLLPNQKEI